MKLLESLKDWIKKEEELESDPVHYEAEIRKLDRLIEELFEENGVSVSDPNKAHQEN